MRGQVLEAEQKTQEAHDACSQPMTANPNYLPAYLCLADVSAHSKNLDDVLKLSAHALEIDATTDAAAYYNAAANLNLNRLPDAEKSALKAWKSTRPTPTHGCIFCWLKSTPRKATAQPKPLNCGNI